jgi:hypothetical protein
MAMKKLIVQVRNSVPVRPETQTVGASRIGGSFASTALPHTKGEIMTGSILTASEFVHHCPRCGKVLRAAASACAECGADHTAAEATHGHATAMSATLTDSPSSAQPVERAPGSGWGPASNAALSLFVFVLIFDLAALFETSGSDSGTKPTARPATATSVITDSSAHSAPQLSAATADQTSLAQKRPALDTALSRARACNRVKSWDCVRLAASEALALDGANIEAQGLLEHSIKQSAWQSHAAAIPAVTAVPSFHDVPASSPVSFLTSGANADQQQRAIARFGWAHPASAR